MKFSRNIDIAIKHRSGLFMRINRLHKSVIEKRFKNLALHRSQNVILMYISRCEEAPSQKDISEILEISPAAVAVSLKKLEVKKMIKRNPSISDARINKIYLTELGENVVKESQEIFLSVDEAMFEGINESDYEFLSSIINRISDNLIRAGAREKTI